MLSHIARFWSIILALVFFVFSPLLFGHHPAYASEYFDRDYAVIYNVKENGTTNVTMNITLTNKTSDYYASSDTIKLGFESLTNVSASDPDGAIQPKITRTEEGNTLELSFNKKVVGKGKALVFTINFDTADIARRQGEIWEINIPGIADSSSFEQFNVEVRVPESFGEPTYIKPSQPDKSLLFTKDQLGTSGISIAYGNTQYYTLDLTYHLQNKNLFPIKTEIALPPTTPYQQVRIDTIEPKPENVTIDRDGNWLATYIILPSQKYDVKVKGKVIVSLIPTQRDHLSEEQRKTYTQEQPYWEVNQAKIKELARELQTPEKIYDYVTSTLTYDFSRVTGQQPRLGAVKSLQNATSAVCLEFTDLFIAIARAAGIPTREVNGFAYTQNQKQRPLSLSQDILHAWPEYYDSQRQQWIMVDPTWGNTTGGIDYFHVLDFDHIVFVRKGIDSKYPIPAGGYKFAGDEKKKDVVVDFTSSFSLSMPAVSFTPSFMTEYVAGFPIKGTVHIANNGSSLIFPSTVKILSETLSPREQFIQIPMMAPYSQIEFPVQFEKTSFLTNSTHTFTMSLHDTNVEHTFRVVPFSATKEQLIGGIASGIFAIILFIIARKTWRLRVSR